MVVVMVTVTMVMPYRSSHHVMVVMMVIGILRDLNTFGRRRLGQPRIIGP
jgi:hypothetical protein